jgi:outer membrane protein insertion porin family
VDVRFDISTGYKMWIGQIDISGNDPTFDKVVRREIPINEGELYSTSKINEGRARLNRLGFFEEVNISTPQGRDDKTLDMKVDVTERPTGSFSVGAGFSNLENFVFTANVSKNNFLGLGYIMSAAANVSGKRQQGNVSLFDPYFLDSRWTLRLETHSISRQFIEDEYQRGGSFAIGRYLDARDDMRLEMIYTIEDTGLTSIDAYKARLLGGQLYKNGLSSSGGLALMVDKRNNRVNATKGIYSSLSSTLTGGWRTNDQEVLSLFGGDFNFYELKANLRTYYPLVKSEALIFKYNGTLGHLGSTDGQILPYIHRYRAGGINSVRGYDWYSLGPSLRGTGFRQGTQSTYWMGSDDPTAADDRLVIGGTRTWINNFEIESPIVKQAGISTVVFFDAGNAFGDVWGEGPINPLGLRTAYGFGVRWFSPMGPLRFEWGFPIDPRADERKVVFDFSMGSLF